MKLTINKNEFYKMAGLAERNSSKNPTLPILSSILVKSSHNNLSLTSTNLEVGFEASLPARVEKEGVVAVPSKPLLSLLSSIPEHELRMESSGNNLKLVSKTSSSNLKCFPHGDFPVLPRIEKESSFGIAAGELVNSLRSTIFSSSVSNLKPELSSVFIFSKSKSPLTFVATDSFRLSEFRTTLSPTEQIALLIPQRSAQEILRIFEDSGDEVLVCFNKNQILLKSNNLSFISRLNEGNFPDYQSVIPKSFSTQIVLDKDQIIDSVKTASVFSGRLSDITVKAGERKDFLEINSNENETGEHHSRVPAKVAGEDFEITFNYRYLLDALHAVPEQKLFLGFNGPARAALVRGAQSSSYFHLVMPMRSS